MPANIITETDLSASAKEWNGSTHEKKTDNKEQQPIRRSIVVPNPNPDDRVNKTVLAYWDEKTEGYVVNIGQHEELDPDDEEEEVPDFVPSDVSDLSDYSGVSSSDESSDDDEDDGDDNESADKYGYGDASPEPKHVQRERQQIEQLKLSNSSSSHSHYRRASLNRRRFYNSRRHSNDGYGSSSLSFNNSYHGSSRHFNNRHQQYHNNHHRQYYPQQHQHQQRPPPRRRSVTTNYRRSSIGTCAAAPTSPPPPPGFNHSQQQHQQQQQHGAPLRRLSQLGSSTATTGTYSANTLPGPQRRASVGTCAAADATVAPPPPPPGFDDSFSSPYDLLDIQILKEIAPDSVEEVQLPGKRGSITQRRSITTFHEEDVIESPTSFDNGDNNMTNNNDSLRVLDWDMSPSLLHHVTKNSKIDSELLEQKMQNFLLGEAAGTTTTTNSTSSVVSTSKVFRRASIA